MKKLFYLIILIVFMVFALTFMQKNPQQVSINYYAGLSIQAPLPIVLFVTFLFGVVFGYLATLVSRFRAHLKMKKAQREAHVASEQLKKLTDPEVK